MRKKLVGSMTLLTVIGISFSAVVLAVSLQQQGSARPGEAKQKTLKEIEKRHILAVLEQTNWVFAGPNGAAARLGIKRSTLQFRMQKLGISRPQKLSAQDSYQ